MANEVRENIYINGTAIPKPPEFELEREDLYAAEYTSMSGKTIADRIGFISLIGILVAIRDCCPSLITVSIIFNFLFSLITLLLYSKTEKF